MMTIGRLGGPPRGFRMDLIAHAGETQADGTFVLTVTHGPLRIAWWRLLAALVGIGRTVNLPS